jgi:hypothetical protein
MFSAVSQFYIRKQRRFCLHGPSFEVSDYNIEADRPFSYLKHNLLSEISGYHSGDSEVYCPLGHVVV